MSPKDRDSTRTEQVYPYRMDQDPSRLALDASDSICTVPSASAEGSYQENPFPESEKNFAF